MTEADPVIRTIACAHLPFYIQLHSDVTNDDIPGRREVGAGHGSGVLEKFKITPPPADGSPYLTTIESVAYPGYYLRMDGTGVNKVEPQGAGVVGKQNGTNEYTSFYIHPQPDGTIAIESQKSRNVYLRAAFLEAPIPKIVFNCQWGIAGPGERFRLDTPPETPRLRVLSYNTHLMKDSFLETITTGERVFAVEAYTVWEDENRKFPIIRNVLDSLADIVALQEVWSPTWADDFKGWLYHAYPYIYLGPTGTGGRTSGLVLASKYPLSEYTFNKFPSMPFPDSQSNKGVIAVTAAIAGMGKLRIGAAHTSGLTHDTSVIARRTVTETKSAEHKTLPAIMMGDLNIHWEKGVANPRYVAMMVNFMFPGGGAHPAADVWIERYGPVDEPNPYTVKMRYNKMHQLFSPSRDTEADARLDYLWNKPGNEWALKPLSVSVPRVDDPNWLYVSPQWHWAHKNRAARVPAAAALGDVLCVVSKDGAASGISAGLMCAIYNRKTLKWKHFYTGINTSATPGIVEYKGKLHLFYRAEKGNGILHRSSTTGDDWNQQPETNLLFNTAGGVFPVVYLEQLHLFHVDPSAPPGRIGGQVHVRAKRADNDDWTRTGWGPDQNVGINTRCDMAAAVLDKRLLCVCRDNGPNGIRRSIQDDLSMQWAPDHTGLATSGSPGIMTIGSRFHLFTAIPIPRETPSSSPLLPMGKTGATMGGTAATTALPMASSRSATTAGCGCFTPIGILPPALKAIIRKTP